MSRFTGKKNRIARRYGINIFGRKRNPMLHKANPPGMHGARRKKKSDYGLMLDEKQKLKAIYGMLSEKQLLNYYERALQKKGNTAHLLANFLECRLDTVVFRLGFAGTIFGAQQLVAHGHIQVNGKKVDRRSFQVEPGMTITLKEKSRAMKAVNEALDAPRHNVPDYLSFDRAGYTGTLLAPPMLEQMPWPIELNLAGICDFLAHSA